MSESPALATFSATDRAITRLREVADAEGIDASSTYLRVAVVTGGCSGLTYDLGWDTVRQPDDELVEVGGLQIVLDLKSPGAQPLSPEIDPPRSHGWSSYAESPLRALLKHPKSLYPRQVG
ncbi:MAG: hypothetical protein AAF170_02440, partial [Bacteroidota bacterium]